MADPNTGRWSLKTTLMDKLHGAGDMSYEMLRFLPYHKEGIAGLRSLLQGTPYENELNALESYERDNPTLEQVAGEKSIVEPSIPAHGRENAEAAEQELALQTAMNFAGGIKTPRGPLPPLSPEFQSAFRLPEGGVVQTGPFHDITKLPEPYNAGENLHRLLSGYADDTQFFTKAQAEKAAKGESMAPPVANEPMPRGSPPPKGTRVIGKIRDWGATHFDEGYTNPKDFMRPTQNPVEEVEDFLANQKTTDLPPDVTRVYSSSDLSPRQPRPPIYPPDIFDSWPKNEAAPLEKLPFPANDPIAETTVIGQVTPVGGYHMPGAVAHGTDKFFPRPETDVGPMPESGLPDETVYFEDLFDKMDVFELTDDGIKPKYPESQTGNPFADLIYPRPAPQPAPPTGPSIMDVWAGTLEKDLPGAWRGNKSPRWLRNLYPRNEPMKP